ncbi:MAG: hypothetical protein LBE56_03440 [Tannerella sp.]|jgi:hypothetical protein|nr:hypothetical protein [Tannerella sp.]
MAQVNPDNESKNNYTRIIIFVVILMIADFATYYLLGYFLGRYAHLAK